MKSRYRTAPTPAAMPAATIKTAPASSSALGVPCRDCGSRIVFTMEQILSGTEITCQCGLTISVVPEQSVEALRDLSELKRRLSQE